jgi:hypothetical protein
LVHRGTLAAGSRVDLDRTGMGRRAQWRAETRRFTLKKLTIDERIAEPVEPLPGRGPEKPGHGLFIII